MTSKRYLTALVGLAFALAAPATASAEQFDPSTEFKLKDWVPIHIGGGGMMKRDLAHKTKVAPGQLEAFLTMAPMTVGETIGMLVFGGVLPRHPDLRVVIAEGGIGWLAYYVLRHDLSEHEEGHRAALREGAGCRPAGHALRQRGEGLRTERVAGGCVKAVATAHG